MKKADHPRPRTGPEALPGGVEAVEKDMPVAAHLCLLLVSLAGAALLAWWAVEFHRSNEQLWMVPTGLVMIGTPAMVWFSASASDASRRLEPARNAAPDLEK